MSGLITPKEMNFVSKRWGWELHIVNGEKYCGKKLFIKQGHHLSFHHHELKDEVLFVESGLVDFIYEKKGQFPVTDELTAAIGWSEVIRVSERMEPGFAFHVEPGMKHQIRAVQDSLIFEFSTQHFDSDSHRTTLDLISPVSFL